MSPFKRPLLKEGNVCVRRGVERWAADAGAPDSFGAMIFVSKLLLESHRLLTPEQARGLWRAVEPMVLDVHDQVAGEARSKFVVLLASFLHFAAVHLPQMLRICIMALPTEADGRHSGQI